MVAANNGRIRSAFAMVRNSGFFAAHLAIFRFSHSFLLSQTTHMMFGRLAVNQLHLAICTAAPERQTHSTSAFSCVGTSHGNVPKFRITQELCLAGRSGGPIVPARLLKLLLRRWPGSHGLCSSMSRAQSGATCAKSISCLCMPEWLRVDLRAQSLITRGCPSYRGGNRIPGRL